MAPTAAVFFDVDFTLIYPGPRFQAVGYQENCARHGITVDPARFEEAVAGAAAVLDGASEIYDPQLYIDFTRRLIELMGGEGDAIETVAREIYVEWAQHHHFSLYDDVPATLRDLRARGMRLGLISNSHRCLASFQSHFELDGLISATVSSSEHGFLKPHPNIYRAAMSLMGVPPSESVMVGDSLLHDVVGARQAGMRGVLLARGKVPANVPEDVPVIRALSELVQVL